MHADSARAMFVPEGALPGGTYDLFAICRGTLSDILMGSEVRLSRRKSASGAKPCRVVAVSLPSARHAQLVSYDGNPDQVEVYIETVGDWNACKADVKEISRLIGIPLQNFVWIATKAQLRAMRQGEGLRISVAAASRK